MVSRAAAVLLALSSAATASTKDDDRVASIPGFESEFQQGLGFDVYSGYLDVQVPKASTGYDSLSIHYELHTCRAKDCPLALWHQGGPGGSAVFGAWTEMGPFQLMAQGPVYNEKNAWNQAAHMLYLESPAGSTIAGSQTGYSTCSIDGKVQDACKWTDVTQAVAYAHTIEAFLEKFPEYKSSELYLTGESYAGQYVPNIAYHVLQSSYSFKITGLAVGNGCWGGTQTSVQCNGPHAEKNDIDIYYGKGLLPTKLYQKIQETCDWSKIAEGDDDDDSLPVAGASAACNTLLDQAEDAVGPYNVYNIYDDCPLADSWHATNPHVSQRAVRAFHRGRMHLSRLELDSAFEEAFDGVTGGYPWDCSSDRALDGYFTRADVQEALHLKGPGSGFKCGAAHESDPTPSPRRHSPDSHTIRARRYKQSGPASQLLWPHLVQHMRVLIYNGDADLCVPYKGNEELVTNLETAGSLVEKAPWQPWYAEKGSQKAPAGYVTTYSVPGKTFPSKGPDASFLTIRLAGHMVPTFQPEAALAFISRFFKGEDF